tara:strand:- start:589 stop:855 length:267 start_codon:yes stop_codon:yes gene_type:complete
MKSLKDALGALGLSTKGNKSTLEGRLSDSEGTSIEEVVVEVQPTMKYKVLRFNPKTGAREEMMIEGKDNLVYAVNGDRGMKDIILENY